MSVRTVAVDQNASVQSPQNGGVLQRACACGNHSHSAGECESCRKKRTKLQRFQNNRGGDVAGQVAPPLVHEALHEPGSPLDAGTRRYMEPRFGRDFSHVRVHTNSRAAQSANEVDALAYTVGHNIVFNQGMYRPETNHGLGLVAHELTHVIQQSDLPAVAVGSEITIGNVDDPAEQEATQISTNLVADASQPINRESHRNVLRRVPWGICPPGPRLPANTIFRWQSAENYMVHVHYRSRGSRCVISNIDRLEEMTCTGREGRMLDEIKTHFRSGRNPRRTRVTAHSQDVPSPPEGGGVLDAIEGAEPVVAELFSLLRPDILDLTRREVYDVTTQSQARGHRNKIRGYVSLLEAITHQNWQAGTSLTPPAISAYPFRPGEAICYGITDFGRWPGVILYEILDISGPDGERRRRQQEGEPERRQPDRERPRDDAERPRSEPERPRGDVERPHSDSQRPRMEAERPRTGVHDPQGLRRMEREAADGARRLEAEAAQALERRLARGVARETEQSIIRRFLRTRFPRIIAERVTRIAASRAARRAASLIPVLGWGFAAVDVYHGVQDIMQGHVARGLTAVTCAGADVASDFLHLGDVVTGPGGTIASLAAQAGLTTCQIAIEMQRVNDRMQELEQEINRSGALPSDDRLRDYYEMDDEAISGLRTSLTQEQSGESQAQPQTSPQPTTTPNSFIGPPLPPVISDQSRIRERMREVFHIFGPNPPANQFDSLVAAVRDRTAPFDLQNPSVSSEFFNAMIAEGFAVGLANRVLRRILRIPDPVSMP